MEFSNGYSRVYPFATENVIGYINDMNLKNKDVLTVGSSLDQAFNSLLFGAKNVTVFDINENIDKYYELKKAAIMSLDRKELLNFLYNDFLNTKDYRQICKELRKNNIDAYYFWDENIVFDKKQDIKDNFFTKDVLPLKKILISNAYLLTDKLYNVLREKLQQKDVKIINGDIFNINNTLEKDEMFDAIFYSNVISSLQLIHNESDSYRFMKKSFIEGISHLNKDGILQYLYLYSISADDFSHYNKNYSTNNKVIERLEKIWRLLNNYQLDLIQVDSVADNGKDSVITYTKKK